MFAVGVLVLGIALVLVVFVLAVPSLTRSGKLEVHLGADTFDAGPAGQRAAAIAVGGPILLPDVASGQRDIWLQHGGEAETEGWSAFDARKPGSSRDCTLRWEGARSAFTDPCDGSVVPADGTGLVHYAVSITDDGRLIVDLRSTNDGSGTTVP